MVYAKENKSCLGFIDLGNGSRTAYLSANGISVMLPQPASIVLGRKPVTLLDFYLLHFIFSNKINKAFCRYYNHPILKKISTVRQFYNILFCTLYQACISIYTANYYGLTQPLN